MISYLTSSATGYQLALSAYTYIHDVYLIFILTHESSDATRPETQRLSSVQSSGSDLENKRQPTTQSGRAQGRASSGLLPGGDCEAAGGHRDSPEARASCGSRIVFFFFSCCASPEAVTGCTWSIYSRPLCDVAGCGLGSDWGTCAHSGTGANGQLKHTRKKHQASVVGEPWFDASSSRLMIHQGYVPKGYLVRVRTHFGGRNPIGCSVDRRS